MTIDNLQWVEAPNHISYGTGMMEAIIPLGKDNSLHLYCPVEQIANVASALKALAQSEQEPVAWLSTDSIGERYLCFDKPLDNDPVQPLYTTPPQRTWVGLTDAEIDQGLLRTPYALQTAEAWREGVRWAYHQLKEKNT